MLGPCERYMTPTLDAALLISSRAVLIWVCHQISIPKGREPRLYEALSDIAGPFFEFTIKNEKDQNKRLTKKKKK